MITGQLDGRKKRLKVEVKSEITGSLTQSLRDGLARLRRQYPPEDWDSMHLDLRGCRIIDSMGLNWLFAESRWIRELDKEFVVRIASPAIHKVMLFARLDKVALIKFRRRKQLR